MKVCKYCGYPLELDESVTPPVWVDLTGGDCCPGDDECNNENESHVPVDAKEGTWTPVDS